MHNRYSGIDNDPFFHLDSVNVASEFVQSHGDDGDDNREPQPQLESRRRCEGRGRVVAGLGTGTGTLALYLLQRKTIGETLEQQQLNSGAAGRYISLSLSLSLSSCF